MTDSRLSPEDAVFTNVVEPFAAFPNSCPKCDGMSFIDRYLVGEALRDDNGRFVLTRYSAAEHLVVRCGLCGYERLMQPLGGRE